MAVNPSANPNRLRNVFFVGVAVGAIGMLLIVLIKPSSGVSKQDIDRLDERLAKIEKKLSEPTPTPQVSASPKVGGQAVSAINKNPKDYIDKTVEVSGKVNSAHQGVGFILVDTDGTFVWIHYKGKIPSGSATVKGKVVELKDQLSQWKNESGWPDNDAELTAKLRDEKVFIEADAVS